LKGLIRGKNPLQNPCFALSFERIDTRESQREASPLFYNPFPLMIGIYIHIMERGIKGVRWINNPNDQL